MRQASFLIVGIFCLAIACDSAPRPVETRAEPAAQSPVKPAAAPKKDEAPETAKAIASFHPVACRIAAADSRFARCHDDTKGYDKALACIRQALAAAEAELPKLPSADVPAGCAGSIQNGIRESGETTARFLSDFIAWMEANREPLRKAMARKPLSDACDDVPEACESQPSNFDFAKYAAYGYARVMKGAECTKSVFVCETDDNVCWLPKVASRLGVACDSNENTFKPLLSRATRQPIVVQRKP